MMNTADLIDTLAADARPLRPMSPPRVRAGIWLALAAAIVILLGVEHGLRPDIAARLANPAFAITVAASMLTAVLAAIGCLVASLPDRSRAWLLLPMPAMAAWFSMIGHGCLTDWVRFESGSLQPGEAWRCLATLLLVSVPLSMAMFVMLRHVARLRPTLVMMTAGLAVAAMTATAMSLLHPLDATLMILLFNPGIAAVIVAIDGLAGRRILACVVSPPRL